MAYQATLRRALDILLEHKYLIGLGVLIALGNGGGSNSGSAYTFGSDDPSQTGAGMPLPDAWPGFASGQLPSPDAWILPAVIVGLLILLGIAIGLVVFVLSSVAQGGLAAGVNTIEEGGGSSFGQAWGMGWSRLWSLLGINFIPAIPVLIGVLLILVSVGTTIGFSTLLDAGSWSDAIVGAGIFLSIALMCILAPLTLGLSLLRTFAVRACMLEGLGVLDSYGRGWRVATSNLGPAIIFFLIQLAISILLSMLLFVPSILSAFCCLLWPIFLLIGGATAAYFSTMWTLVWRAWTGAEPGGASVEA